MWFLRSAVPFALVACMAPFVSSCGESCDYEEVPVCEVWETPDRIAGGGDWEGTYNVDRYWVGDNDLYMKWGDFEYTLILKRKAHFWRRPLYRDGDMVHTGPRGAQQTNFKVQYKPGEWWYFEGRYMISGNETVFKGTIHTHGQWIGRFEMRRPRACLYEGTATREVCYRDILPFTYGLPFTESTSETNTDDFDIVDVSISPNPVTTGGQFHVTAKTRPAMNRDWQVWIAPYYQPDNHTTLLSKPLSALDFYATPPTQHGEYKVGIHVTEGNKNRVRSYPLSVTIP